MHTESTDTTPTHSDPLAWLREHREKTQREHAAFTRTEHIGTTARLASFSAAIAAADVLRHTPWLSVTSAVALLGVFWWTVRWHRDAKARRELIDRVLLVIAESFGSLTCRPEHQPTDLLGKRIRQSILQAEYDPNMMTLARL